MQVPGEAMRIAADRLRKAIAQSPSALTYHSPEKMH